MEKLYAVITGDVVGSTLMDDDYHSILKSLITNIRAELDTELKFEAYRGDSFQVLTSNIGKSLLMAVLLRAGFRSKTANQKSEDSGDIRLTLGIGTVSSEITALGTMEGEAFTRSGRALDEMKKSQERLKIVIGEEKTDAIFDAVCPMADDVIRGWSQPQAEAVFLYLLQPQLNQAEIGARVGTTQRAVSKRLDASRIEVLIPFLQYYEKLLKWKFNS